MVSRYQCVYLPDVGVDVFTYPGIFAYGSTLCALWLPMCLFGYIRHSVFITAFSVLAMIGYAICVKVRGLGLWIYGLSFKVYGFRILQSSRFASMAVVVMEGCILWTLWLYPSVWTQRSKTNYICIIYNTSLCMYSCTYVPIWSYLCMHWCMDDACVVRECACTCLWEGCRRWSVCMGIHIAILHMRMYFVTTA